jgi:hypothetical protein
VLHGAAQPSPQASRHDARKNRRAVRVDMEGLKIGGVVALEREANNRESFQKLSSAYTQT